MNPITPAELAAYFDHTQLRAYAQRKDFEKLCAEAREYGFAMVAINPAPVSLCKDLLAGTSVHVGAAVGFPLGQSTPQVKKYELLSFYKYPLMQYVLTIILSLVWISLKGIFISVWYKVWYSSYKKCGTAPACKNK